MSGDGATIHSQDAANALGSYDGAAESLKANYKTKAQAVLTAFADGSWIGDGDAADAFRQNFKPDEVTKFLDPTATFDPKATEQSQTGGAIVGGVANLGVTARQAIEQSLGSDQQQADEMKKAQRKASVGAHDSGSSGSTGTSTGAPSSRSGAGSPGTGSGTTAQRTQAVQDAVLLQSGTTGATGQAPTTAPVGQLTGQETARRNVLGNHPLQPLDRPLPGQPGHVTSHETTRDNVLPHHPLQPLDRPLPGQPGHVTSHETTRDNVLPHHPLQPLDRPLPGQPGHVTSHETTRDNVLPNHPLQPLDRPLPGQPGHVTSHETTRDNVLPTQLVDHPVSHEATRGNVLPGHDDTDSQTPADTARTPHHVAARHPVIDNEVAPQTTQAPDRNES